MEEGAVEPRAGHRADIQGLRAVAVAIVVACHSGLPLPGGFVGVDVFFVISGYVIGAALLRGLDGGDGVGFAAFYARRARRLLPSLALVVAVAVAVGVLVLDPFAAQETAFRTSLASSLFVGNVELYRHVGYFDASADAANPFLHLWSLSVEEQFYLVLPALLWAGWRLGRRRGALVVVAGLALASLVVSWLLVVGIWEPVEAPQRLAFFASATRFWELAIGVLLAGARVPSRLRGRAGAVPLAGAGLALVALAAIATDPLGPFPGPGALPAVVGAALVVAGADATGVGRALAVAPLRWLGDRSYTWYLWHWPAIVYARMLWPGSRGAPILAALVALAVAAAAYALIEDPIRRREQLVGWRAVRLAALCTAVGVGASIVGLRGAVDGWGVERPADWAAISTARGDGCLLYNRDLANELPASCTLEPPVATAGRVLVVGDDHAASMSTAVLEVVGPQGGRVTTWARSGCPLTDAAPTDYPRCDEWRDEVVELVERTRPDLVVIANRSTSYTTDAPPPPAVVGPIALPGGDAVASERDAIDAWGVGLRSMVERVSATGSAVVVVGGPPTYREQFPVPTLLRPDASPPVRERVDVDHDHDPVVAAERDALDDLDGVAYVDAVPALCDPQACTPYVGGRWTNLDALDLNDHGARLLEPALAAAVTEALDGR